MLKKIIKKTNSIKNMYIMRKKQQEIADIELMIQKNEKAYEFLNEDEQQIKEMNNEIATTKAIIQQLEDDVQSMLQTPLSEQNTMEFVTKSNQLHDFVQQQDILRSSRETTLRHHEANIHNFNTTKHELYKRLEDLQNELSALQQN